MSRRPLDNQSVCSSNAAEEYVNFIAEHTAPVAFFVIESSFLSFLQSFAGGSQVYGSDNWQNAKVSSELKDFSDVHHKLSVAQDYDVLL